MVVSRAEGPILNGKLTPFIRSCGLLEKCLESSNFPRDTKQGIRLKIQFIKTQSQLEEYKHPKPFESGSWNFPRRQDVVRFSCTDFGFFIKNVRN